MGLHYKSCNYTSEDNIVCAIDKESAEAKHSDRRGLDYYPRYIIP